MDLGMGSSWPSEMIEIIAMHKTMLRFLGVKVRKEPPPFSKVLEVLMKFKSLPKYVGAQLCLLGVA